LKGFWVGLALKGGISAISGLLFRRLYNRPLQLLSETFGVDTWRFSLFLAVFNSSYKAVQCFLRRLRQKDDKYNSWIAGLLAGTSILIDDGGRRSTIALWILSRALDLLWRHNVNRGRLPDVPYGSVLAFCLSSCQVMWAWGLEPYALPSGYHKWISARGGLDDRVVRGVRHITRFKQPDVESWCAENNIPHWNPPNPTLMPCSVLHPLEPHSCTLHAIKRWFIGFKTSIPVYTTVHGLPLIIFRLKQLMAEPLTCTLRTAKAICYSTSFITSFQTIYWITFCSVRKLANRDTTWAHFSAGFMAGLSLLWEKESRRGELALFTIPRAIDSAWKILKRYKMVRDVKHAETFIFAISAAFVMMFHQHRSDVIKPTYKGLLARFFGVN
jgi:Tim17/Tim22/Tim23/Pmp24 family